MRGARTQDSRIRVLTLTLDAGSTYGGAEKLVHEFARRLDPARFQSYLCSIHRSTGEHRGARNTDAAELAAAGVRVLDLNQPGFSLVSPLGWWRLYRLLSSESIDIVHAHLARASVPGVILAKLARVPVVICHEHGVPEAKLLRTLLDRNIVARLSTVMLAVSEWDRRQLIELESIPPSKIRVFCSGVGALAAGVAEVRTELGLPPDAPLVGAVGRLAKEKAFDELIRAMAHIRDRGTLAWCAIAGDGPEESRLRELIAELRLEDTVRLLGRRHDTARLIRALDVAVLSSRREGSPLVIMEYMACARPIVATAVGGVPEMIDDGVHGLLVTPGNSQALADAIGHVLADRDLARRLGREARTRQQEQFDLDVVVGRLEQLYLDLCGASRTARTKHAERSRQ